jgi:uncharacterized protein YlzI (FlbEa/FlbD family)
MEIFELIEDVNGDEYTVWLNTAHIVHIEEKDENGFTVVRMTNGKSHYIVEKDAMALRTLLHASKAN